MLKFLIVTNFRASYSQLFIIKIIPYNKKANKPEDQSKDIIMAE